MAGTVQHTHFVAAFPSRDIRAVPSFVFSIPEGWILDEAPQALTVVRPPAAVDGFWVNLLITHDLVARSVDLDQAAAVTLERMRRQCATVDVTMEKFALFGTRACFLRSVEFTKEADGRPLAQVHAMFFGPIDGGGKVIDFFHLVGTCTVEQLDAYGPAMIEVIASFRFT